MNVIGPFHCVRAVKETDARRRRWTDHQHHQRGRIRRQGSSIPYAASKAALNNLTVALARALAPKIRVNAIAPGFITRPLARSKDWATAMSKPRHAVRAAVPAGARFRARRHRRGDLEPGHRLADGHRPDPGLRRRDADRQTAVGSQRATAVFDVRSRRHERIGHSGSAEPPINRPPISSAAACGSVHYLARRRVVFYWAGWLLRDTSQPRRQRNSGFTTAGWVASRSGVHTIWTWHDRAGGGRSGVAWIAGRPGRRLLVAAVVAVVATGLVLTARALGANFGGLFTGWPNQSLGFAPRIQFSLAPLTVGLSRTNLGVNVGYETMSRATLWAWPVLMALPVSALWLPWAVFWPARTPANGRVAAPGSKEAPHDQWLERRLKRLFWTAAWCAAASAVLVVVWYLDYVGDYLLNPDAAAFFLSLGENVAGGFMTFSLGAMLAAAMGLIAARHWRPASARRSSCWHCAARCSPSCVTPSSADSRFDKALAALIRVEQYGDRLEGMKSSIPASRPMTIARPLWSFDVAADLRLPLVEPFSWCGPGSLVAAGVPFLLLPIVYSWPRCRGRDLPIVPRASDPDRR